MSWEAFIRLGPHSWTVEEAPRGATTTDELAVLDDLKFSWEMPRGGLWPLQPEPMVATMQLTVPEFAGVDELGEGDLLTLEVKADAAGPIVARFYGDVTDLEAGPRPGRTGVLLSVVAVDVTVRTRELNPSELVVFINPMDDDAAVDTLWQYYLDGVGIYAGPGDPIWAVPVRSHEILQAATTNARKLIDSLLLQAHSATHRLLLSPIIDPATGDLIAPVDSPSGRRWTLDRLHNDPVGDSSPLVLPSSAVDMDSLRWAIAKGDNPGHIQVVGWNQDDTNVAQYDVPGATSDTYAVVPSTYWDGFAPAGTTAAADAASLAEFYGTAWAKWQVKTLCVLVSRTDCAELIPEDLFPDWTAAEEADTSRYRCYTRYVMLAGTEDTVTPNGLDVQGVLVGCECRIIGGDLELTMQLRIPVATHPDAPAVLAGTGWAQTPHAELLEI